jgi:hypothetical protein
MQVCLRASPALLRNRGLGGVGAGGLGSGGVYLWGGETDDMRLCTSWIADLRAVCARVEERWGKKLVLYEG